MCRRSILICFFFSILLVACVPTEGEPTATAVAEIMETETAVSTPTPNSLAPINTTRQTTPSATSTTPATRPPTSTPTPWLTNTPTPSPTATLLPTLLPSPTATPSHPIFLLYAHESYQFGMSRAYTEPYWVIYGDGQMFIEVGEWKSRTLMAGHLSPDEMCALREQIASTGFLDRATYETYDISREVFLHEPSFMIQIEDNFYWFFSSAIPDLEGALADGYNFVATYQPEQPLVPYVPERLLVWIYEWFEDVPKEVYAWPEELPPLSELRANVNEEDTAVIEGDLVMDFWQIFANDRFVHVYQEGDTIYTVLVRAVLPHDTQQTLYHFPSQSLDNVSVLNCN